MYILDCGDTHIVRCTVHVLAVPRQGVFILQAVLCECGLHQPYCQNQGAENQKTSFCCSTAHVNFLLPEVVQRCSVPERSRQPRRITLTVADGCCFADTYGD